MKLEPLSECMYISQPKMAKICVRHLVTICDNIPEQAKVMGENLSMTVNKNCLQEEDGRSHLKLLLSLSNDMVVKQVDKIRVCLCHKWSTWLILFLRSYRERQVLYPTNMQHLHDARVTKRVVNLV